MNSKAYKLQEPRTKSKYKYGYNSQIYDISPIASENSVSFDQKLGVTRVKQPSFTFPEKIKSKPNFSVDKVAAFTDAKLNSKASKDKNNLIVVSKAQKYEKTINRDR